MALLSIELDRDSESDLRQLVALDPSNLTLATTKKFEVDLATYTLIATVTVATIKAIRDILIERIRARRYVALKINGRLITGLNEDQLDEILERILTK